jgi:hypothetical protein
MRIIAILSRERAQRFVERRLTTRASGEPAIEGSLARISAVHAEQTVFRRVTLTPADFGLVLGIGTGRALVGGYDTAAEGN